MDDAQTCKLSLLDWTVICAMPSSQLCHVLVIYQTV
jgi:hypothetical protein